MQDETIRTTCYPMAPDLRRCAIYAMVGLHLIAIVNFWVGNFVQNRGVTNIVWGCGVIIAISLSMFIPLNWRIRVSSKGISRRAFFRWDHWSWEDIASGKLVKKYPRKMTDTTRNFWRRSFNLGHLQQEDYQTVMELINRHYKLPPVLELPKELLLKYGFRKTATINRNGIQVIDKGEIHVYGWDELQQVRIVRVEPNTHLFSTLELSLPDREIKLKKNGDTPLWKGATDDEVNEFILGHTSDDRVVIDISGERPQRVQDIEKNLAFSRTRTRAFRNRKWFFLVLFLSGVVSGFIKNNFLVAMTFVEVVSIFLSIMFGLEKKSWEKEVEKLEQMLAQCKQIENR